MKTAQTQIEKKQSSREQMSNSHTENTENAKLAEVNKFFV